MEQFQIHTFDNEYFDYNFVSRNESIPHACRELSWISSHENLDLSLLTNCQKLYFFCSYSRTHGCVTELPRVQSHSLGTQQQLEHDISKDVNHTFEKKKKSMGFPDLPPSIQSLYLDGNLIGYLDVGQYQYLQYIKITYLFEGCIHNIRPSCRTLFLRNIFNDISETQIEKVSCYYVNFSYLPFKLKYLSVENCEILCGMARFTNLRVLHLGDWFNSSVAELQFLSQCQEIKFGRNFNNPIDGYLPSNLQKLFIHSIFFNKTCRNLPPRLILLDISSYHQIDLSNLPVSLKYLSIYNQRSDMLPSGIEYLNSRIVNRMTEFTHWPNSIKKIFVKKFLAEKENLSKELCAKISYVY